MADIRLRELERLANAGDPDARAALARAQLRAGGRDPRHKPLPGDVVRVAMHGANFERWDERRVASCEEASKLPWHVPGVNTLLLYRGNMIDERGCTRERGQTTCGRVHWERSAESMNGLTGWGRYYKRNTFLLSSWRTWAKNGEVVVFAESSHDE